MANLNARAYSDTGLALTAQFEGLRLTAYQDAAGVWTIGHGHTGHDVHPGLTITTAQATQLLRQDAASAAAAVNRLVTCPLTQNQFDALVDFVFNLGAGIFARSTLLQKLNRDSLTAAAAEFARWNRAGTTVLPGLMQRRQAETALFLSPDESIPAAIAS